MVTVLLTSAMMLLLGPITLSLFLLCIFLRILRCIQRRSLAKKFTMADNISPKLCAFFHPYCNAGGGGERVLWMAIQAIQLKYPDVICIVYTGDTDASEIDISKNVKNVFGIILPRPVHFVWLRSRGLVEARLYPIFTLIAQSFGSMILGLEALVRSPPDIYIDSMGYAFTLPIFRYLSGCQVAAYVHYPTISTDMIDLVDKRAENFNNSRLISNSALLSRAKLTYYRLFASIYGWMGRSCAVVMVNSSWTLGHVTAIWRISDRTSVVYPPCNTADLVTTELVSRQPYIVSVGQFRPEKNHSLQLSAFARFLADLPSQLEKRKTDFRLILIGGCRHQVDRDRVERLQQMAVDLKIDGQVDFMVNAGYSKLKETYGQATIGLHTMKDEHFGIGVVECMAAGMVIVAHNSGGPKLDIVTKETGFLASTEAEYASAFTTVFTQTKDDRSCMTRAAIQRSDQFSDDNFSMGFLNSIDCLIGK